MSLDVHFSSRATDWITPPEVFDPLDAQFHFALDVCAADERAARCANFIPPEFDTLQQRWADFLEPDAFAWMNPVYGDAEQPCAETIPGMIRALAEGDVFGRIPVLDSDAAPTLPACKKLGCVRRGWHATRYLPGIADFVRHAARQTETDGVRSVWLVPARTDTRWWHETIWDKTFQCPRENRLVAFVPGRIRFLTGDGDRRDSAPFPSAIIVSGPGIQSDRLRWLPDVTQFRLTT